MHYSSSKYHKPVNRFSDRKILVIGDSLLDQYYRGNSSRLCPEAPVPIVDVQETTHQPGGAANTAYNLAALGAQVRFCSVVGTDVAGEKVRSILNASGVYTDGLIACHTRDTQTKSRVVSGHQLIARMDQGSTDPIDDSTANRLLDYITRHYAECDAVVVSDYDKGVVTEKLLKGLLDLRSKFHTPVAIDSKRLRFYTTLKPDFIKPNYYEALNFIASGPVPAKRAEQIMQHADILLESAQADNALVTLDCDGVVVVSRDRAPQHLPADPVTSPQVSGAGDTFLSAFILAYVSGADRTTSAEIAIAASSIAVAQQGTAACSQDELRRYFNIHVKHIVTMQELSDLCERYHREGRKIVFTNGCFDILHSGHVTYLHRARTLGDVLIVGLNNDGSIRRLKGAERPINTLADRLQVLGGLSSVDHVIAFGDPGDDTPVPLIKTIRPHVFVKGGDYTPTDLPEAASVEAVGGSIVILDHIPHHSTTRIINRIRKQRQKATSEHDRLGKLQ